MISGIREANCAWHNLGLLCILLFLLEAPGFAKNPDPHPRLQQKGDIQILDDHYLRGTPKGWIVPEDYHDTFGRRRIIYYEGGGISDDIRVGRFGHISGRFLYTTWRPIYPLSNETYAEGKKTIYHKHVSNLVSPEFEIKLDYITFLISGGYAPNEACLNLLIDGKVVRTATGENDDRLEWAAFDVKAFKGKKAKIQVLDTTTKPFGYVTVDCVCQSPNTKNARRVISQTPKINSGKAKIETSSAKHEGSVKLKEGRLLIGDQAIELSEILSWDAGAKIGDTNVKRVILTNGDVIMGEVQELKDDKLIMKHKRLGDLALSVTQVNQALFNPGPIVQAKPGTLIHSNGNKIPGELTYIRKDNISLKCALGQLPLPRGRVKAFVFSEAEEVQTAGKLTLVDGSILSGKIKIDKEGFVLTHTVLGSVKLALGDIAKMSRNSGGRSSLVSLKSKIREQSGAIHPPAPLKLNNDQGEVLRMYSNSKIKFTVPKSASKKGFRGVLAPIDHLRQALTVEIKAGATKKSFTVQPNSEGIPVDIDIDTASEIELAVFTDSAVSFPSAIEWRNAYIIEDQK